VSSELRELGLADLRLHPGDHVCAFHFGAGQRDALLLPYLHEGLGAGERCVCILPPEQAPGLLDRVATAGGALVGPAPHGTRVRPADAATEPPALVRRIGFVAESGTVGAPAGDHGVPVRVAADVGWVRDEHGQRRAWLDHERTLTRYVQRSRQVALCLCDLERTEPSTVMDLLASHPQVLLGRQLVRGALYAGRPGEARRRPAALEGVLALSALMAMTHDVGRIAALVGQAVASVGRCRLDGVVIDGAGWRAAGGPCRLAAVQAVVEARLAAMGPAGGPLPVPDEPWAAALPLRNVHGTFGWLLVAGDAEPDGGEHFLLQLVAFQASAALAGARVQRRQRALLGELHRTRAELAEMTSLLDWRASTHERLRQALATRAGAAGIAEALHETTGHTVVVEDADGAVQAWTGMEEPAADRDGAPAPAAEERERLLERAGRADQPIWDGERLVAVAERDGVVLGTVAFAAPAGDVSEGEVLALADAAALVAVELDHRRELDETEASLGRDLVDDLLAGATGRTVAARARALGFDVGRPHRVVLVEPRPGGSGDLGVGVDVLADLDAFGRAVRRAARDTGLGAFVSRREHDVVVLSGADGPWAPLRAAVAAEPGGGACRIGVGERCDDLAELPTSLRQATLALKLQDAFGEIDDVVEFEALGVYRLLVETAEGGGVERFVRDWLRPLGPLLDHDAENRSELVATLTQYLRCGGRYDATAHALSVHRSTLKYRLQRIREVIGRDLNDPDTVFELQLATRAWRTLARLRP
jgi:sugar diacid utilization regulator